MQITNQKKMAAQLLKCGVHRVWINPSYLDQVAQSVQKEDIREAIDNGWIKACLLYTSPSPRDPE